MVSINNITTKESFIRHIELFDEEIHPMQILSVHVGADSPVRNWKCWELSDKFQNTWTITFTGNVGEFKVEGEENGKPFAVFFYFSGSKAEINMAIENGRKLKADRFLNKYKFLALHICCYFKLGYLN